VEETLEIYGDMLYRLCLVMLGNASDAEDAVQETFLTYIKKTPVFKDPEHEKAWLITVASNKCRDILRLNKRRPMIDINCIEAVSDEIHDSGIIEALMLLPEKYKLVLELYYVEEYRIDEIAKMINRTPSAVKMRLQKGRRLLAEKYREECI